MRYVVTGNENHPPIRHYAEGRGGGRPLARRGPALTREKSATDQRRTPPAGGISLAAVLGGTLLRWGR